VVSHRHAPRSILVSIVVSLLLGSLVVAIPVSAASPRHPNASGRYIVVARSHADFAATRLAALHAGATIIDELPATDTLVVSGSSSAHTALAADSHVEAVALDHLERIVPPEAAGLSRFHAPKGNAGSSEHQSVKPDPAFSLKGLMWSFARIGAQDAWKSTLGRSSVVVGVADTGLDFTHPELASKVVHVEDFTVSEDPPLCTTYFDYSDADAAAKFGGPATTDWNGHGSWIGGNIAGALDGVGVNGIAPKISLVALKIAQWCGYAYDSTILSAFQYAADNGINIVSISFGGYLDRSDPNQDTIYNEYVKTVAYARSKGTLIVAAAGNEHTRIGGGGRVLSHGHLWLPGDVPDPVANPIDFYGLYEVPGGIPGVVDVSATDNVVVGESRSCAAGTAGSTTDQNATCKPTSDAHDPAGVGRKSQLAYYSNYGPRIDVAAPGGARKFNLPYWDRGGTPGWPVTDADGTTAYEDFSITSDWALQIPCYVNLGPQFYPDTCYSIIQGTSMATPHASAVLALIASAHPRLAHNPAALVWLLKSTASSISGNATTAISATDTSPGDLSGVACPTGYCHLGGPRISDSDAYGAGLVDAEAGVR
jgi:subtilisin family serine protease